MLSSSLRGVARRVVCHERRAAASAATSTSLSSTSSSSFAPAFVCERWFSGGAKSPNGGSWSPPEAARGMSLSTAKEAKGADAPVEDGSRREDFVGIRSGAALTHIPRMYEPEGFAQFDIFQLLNNDGDLVDGAELPEIDEDTMINMYKYMVRLQEIDVVFQAAHRQGRISFYMTSTGEEAAMIGSASALDPQDQVFGQYRETGVIMWRGFTVQNVADQLFGNDNSTCRGRSMPMLFGSKKLHFHTMSAPLTTQMPQATGAAFALKGTNNCVICYFGEGAASEGDFHPALNFAACLECPVVFFCRNNGYAISTGTEEQYRGDGIGSRAIGYGMHTIRVDGNDVFAVHQATKMAREVAVRSSKPVLVEAMTYRVGHHSTSDDSTAYRSVGEINSWKFQRDPVERFRNFLLKRGIWDAEMESAHRAEEKRAVLASIPKAENMVKPSIDTLFTDVYKVMPKHLKEQQAELKAHMDKYGIEA